MADRYYLETRVVTDETHSDGWEKVKLVDNEDGTYSQSVRNTTEELLISDCKILLQEIRDLLTIIKNQNIL